MQGQEKKFVGPIRDQMWALRRRLSVDPDADPLAWVITNQLACSQRPLRDHPLFRDQKPLPQEAGPYVVKWVERVRELGIQSVICLMHSKELRYYDGLTGLEDGLLDLYRKVGFRVRHLQWADPAHAKTEDARTALRARVEEIKVRAYEAFLQLPKPVLIHCSAAIDRSTPVAAYIAAISRSA
jgi:hypothetical protein